MSFKAFVRVLTDDYKASPDLTLLALKNIHIILKNGTLESKTEIISESPYDVFMMASTKIFSWESR